MVETYFVQNFMQIQNLVSKLTSEVAHQSTSKISILRFQQDDAIFLGHLDFKSWIFFTFTCIHAS